MRSNIVEIAGGTFVVTAISYATGIAYYNAFFRSINGNPDLFSVSLERVLFEGGRQLLYLAFKPILLLAVVAMVLAVIHTVLKKYNINVLSKIAGAVSGSPIGKTFSFFSWAYLFIFMALITSISFDSGRAAGEKYGAEASCLRSKVVTEKKVIIGCLLYKADTEVWIATHDDGNKVLLNIPNDKYLSITVF